MEINHYKYIKRWKRKINSKFYFEIALISFFFYYLNILTHVSQPSKPRIWKERSDPILLLNRFINDWTRVCQKLIYALGVAAVGLAAAGLADAPFFLGLFLDFSILALIY